MSDDSDGSLAEPLAKNTGEDKIEENVELQGGCREEEESSDGGLLEDEEKEIVSKEGKGIPEVSEDEEDELLKGRKKKGIRILDEDTDSDSEDSSPESRIPSPPEKDKNKSDFIANDKTMFDIRSSAQRRLRESGVEIPYHVPKKLSLDEFLSRKKLIENSSEEREKALESIYKEVEDEAEKNPALEDSEAPSQKKKSSFLLRKLGVDLSLLNSTPDIRPEKVINLGAIETPVLRPKGLTELQSRFVKHVRSAPSSLKSDRVVSVVSKVLQEDGETQLKCSNIILTNEVENDQRTIDFDCVNEAKRSEISGAQLRALKGVLKKKMFEKREEERLRREKLKKEDEEEEEYEEEIASDAITDEEEEEESESDGEKRPSNNFVDEEAEETMSLALEDDSSQEDFQDNVSKSTTPFSQIVNSSRPRWTPLEERQEVEETATQQHARKRLGFEGLFDESDPRVDDFGDVIDLCSGQFVTQKPVSDISLDKPDKEDFVTDTPDTVIITQNSSLAQSLKSSQLTNDFSEFNEYVDEEGVVKSVKKGTKRLALSDEDSSEDEGNDINSECENPADIEYDSDENEIPPPNKSSTKLFRENFFENEAELSGSEGGSEDEDEQEMDKLELEEGDLDDIDHDQVREEVGKIHHNQILDDDRREVRLFQEAFLEDGDLHSDKTRERTFKWLNNDESEELEKKASDDEEEDESQISEKLAIERLDREKWLKDPTLNANGSDDDEKNESQFFNLGNKALKKLEDSKKNSNSQPKKIRGVSSPSKKLPLQLVPINESKGSFLSRASSKLTKIAELTKNKGESREGSGVKSNSKNFVFCSISPKKSKNEDDNVGQRSALKSRRNKPPVNCPLQKKPRTLTEDNIKSSIFGFL